MVASSSLSFLLHDVARLLARRFEQRAKNLGLTRSQWQALSYLANNEGIHQAGLAEMLDIEPITLVRLLDKLAERGLVERRQHPTDRRAWLLYLGDEARPLMDDMGVLGEMTRSEALLDVPPEDVHRLSDTLTIMKSNLIKSCRTAVADQETYHG